MRKKMWSVVGGVVLAGMGLACASGPDAPDNPTPVDAQGVVASTTPKPDEVKLTSCKQDQFGLVNASYELTNPAKEPRSYFIQVEVNEGKTKVGDAFGTEETVEQGKLVKGTAVGTVVESARGAKITCVLKSY